jgi:pimeloyl-ACP methyl ester carboxylesterase
VHLGDRGTVFVREIDGPPGGATLVLLHGWTATADLNFFTCYPALRDRHHAVAFDHRGHGRGLRSKKAFRLEDCADDVIALADELGIERVIPVGYSMGGTIAQLLTATPTGWTGWCCARRRRTSPASAPSGCRSSVSPASPPWHASRRCRPASG